MFKSNVAKKYQIIVADLAPYRDKLWIHYSKHREMKFKYKTFHLDPIGIYFFPEGFKTQGSWHHNLYKFTARLKPSANVLDLATIKDKNSTFKLLESLKAIPKGDDQDWPPFQKNIEKGGTEHQSPIDLAWEWLQRHFMGKKAAFTKAFLNAGYDAIFDDTDSIFHGETQLIVMNPKVLTDIKRVDQTDTGFKQVEEARQVILNALKKYDGKILKDEKPKKKKGFGRDPSYIGSLIKFGHEEREKIVDPTFKYNVYGREITFGIRTRSPSDSARPAVELSVQAEGTSDTFSAVHKELWPNDWSGKHSEIKTWKLEEFNPDELNNFVVNKAMKMLWDDEEAQQYKNKIKELRDKNV